MVIEMYKCNQYTSVPVSFFNNVAADSVAIY